MKKRILLALFAVFLSGPLEASAQRGPNLADPVYNVCRSSDDCAIVRPPCGAPLGVNKPHEDEVNGWYNFLRPSTKCADWITLPEAKDVICVKNRCVVELAESGSSPDASPYEKDPGYCEKNEDCTTVVLQEDCCVKHFVNTVQAERVRRQLFDKRYERICPSIDRRHVKDLRCENNKCTADLEVPLELPGMLLKLKAKCEQ
jgi:hypothetical protein